ncbi:MAG: hypothetical protein R3Y63_00715 [Eubacteriales bacterium]
MYNPYLEEDSFLPLEEATGELSQGNSQPTGLKNVASLKDSFLKLGDLSAVTDLFSSKVVTDLFSSKSEKKGSHVVGATQTEPSENFLDGMKKKLRLDELDGGDILLVMILIYLMLEGDDKIELAITLGILGFLWFLEGKEKED